MTLKTGTSKALVVSLLALMLFGSFLLIYVPTVQDAHASGGLSIDGTATLGSCVSPCTVNISTSDSKDIIVVVFMANLGTTVSSVVDAGSAGLTFSTRFVCAGDTTGSIGRAMCEYYSGPTSAPLSSEGIQLTTSGGGNVLIFGVNGADTASPWDPNVALPVEAAGPSGTACSVSTSNANDMLLSYAADGGVPVFTVPAQSGGYTQVTAQFGGAPSVMGAYDVVSSTQSSAQTSWTYTSGTADYQELCDAIQGQVTQPIQCSMQAGVPSGDNAVLTLTDSDGSTPSPSSVTCNGSSTNVAADPSTTLTATEPSDGSNTRYRFSGFTTTTTDSTCSSGTCGAWSFTDYYQLQNTYQASPAAPTTWNTGGLAIDGFVTEGGATCSTGCTADLTTAHANDIVVVEIQANSGTTVSSITDTGSAGLTFSTRFACSGSARTLCEYYSGPASSALTSEPIKVTSSPSESQFEVLMFGVTGANTASPWDANGGLPNEASSSKTCTVSTSHASDMLITEIGDGNGPTFTVPSGFTQVTGQVGSGFSGMAAYHVVSSTQSSVSVTWTESGGSAGPETLCDAIQAATPVSAIGTQLGVGTQTICTMGAPSYGTSTAISCSGWADYDTAVSLGQLTVTSNNRWYPLTASYTDTTGGNSHTDSYYEQLQNTYQASPSVPSTWDVSGLSLDGSADNICSAVTSCSASLTTHDTNDVVVVFCYANTVGTGGAVTGFTVSASGLSFTQRLYYSSQKATAEDYTVAASTLSSVSFSCGTNAGAGNVNIGILVLGINGALTSSPYDTSGSLPNEQSSSTTTGMCTMTTVNANDFLIGETSHNGATLNSIPSGFTALLTQSGSPSGALDYEIAGSIQNSVTESWSYNSGSLSDNICDAIRAAVSPVTATGTYLGSSGQTICTTNLPTAGSGTAISCSGWADYDTAVTMGVLTASANERWSPATATYTDTSGGNTHTDNYYEQLQNTYTATPFVPSTWDTGALSVDGSASNSCSNAGSCSATISTVFTNDVIVVWCSGNSGSPSNVNTPSDSASSLSWTQRGTQYTGNLREESVYYAVSSGTLSSDSISCNFSATQNIATIVVFGVSNANTFSPFDPNVGLPNQNSNPSSTNPTCTISTSNANDLLVSFVQDPSSGGSNPSGFSTLGSSPAYGAYEVVSSTQSSVTETWTIGQNRWDSWCDAIQGATSVTATGTALGVAGQTICTMGAPTRGGSTAISCSGYADYNKAVTMGVLQVSSNERWSPAVATYTDTTGGNVHTDNYYEQLQNTYQATPNAQATWDNGLTAPNAVGTLLGTSGQTVCSITLPNNGGAESCSGYADYNKAVVIGSATIAGAPANSQWLRSGACSFTQTTGGNTNNCNFYKQWSNTFQITAKAQTAFDGGLSLVVTGTSLGAASNICTISPAFGAATGSCSGYSDANTAATFAASVGGASSNTRWENAGNGATSTASIASGGNTFNTNYYKQLQNTYLDTPNAQATWDAGLTFTVTGTYLGTSSSTLCTVSPAGGSGQTSCSGWTDYGQPFAVSNPTGAASNTRWQIGAASTDYVTITLTNSQAAATPTLFQQMITFNPSTYAAFEKSDLGNIRFCADAACTQPLYAWLESCVASCGTSATSATVWVRLTSAIAGSGGTATIYMVFLPTTADFDGTYWGEAPNLSGTYGQYDNGPRVFTFYDNFNGTSLDAAKWNTYVNGATLTINNGLSLTGPSASFSNKVAAVYSDSTFGAGVVDFYASSGLTIPSGSQNFCASFVGLWAENNIDSFHNTASIGSCNAVATNTIMLFNENNAGSYNDVTRSSPYGNAGIYSVIVPSSTPSSISAQFGYGSTGTSSTNLPTLPQNIAFTVEYNGVTISHVDWVRQRAYPPSGVMPSVSLGGVSGGSSSAAPTSTGYSFNTNYYKQLQNTYEATPNAQLTWDNGLTALNAVGTVLGSSGQTVCSITLPNGGGAQTCTGYEDYNTGVVIGSVTISGAPSNSRWLRSGSCSFTQTTGGNTDNCNYYKQLTNTYTASPQAPHSWDSVLSMSPTGSYLGTAGATICTITTSSGGGSASCTGYADYNAPVVFPATVGDGPNVQWTGAAPLSFTDTTGGNTHSVNYYEELQNTYLVSPVAPTTFDGNIVFAFTGTVAGNGGQTICSITLPASPVPGSYSCSGYSDYDSAVTAASISTSNPSNIRWEVSGVSSFLDTTGGNSHAANYYEQLLNTYAFSPASPAAWDNALSPAIAGTYLGVTGQTVCTASLTSGGGAASCSGYADYATAVSFPASIADGGSKQWTGAAPLFFTDSTGGNTHTVSYYEQYSALTFSADPSSPSTWDSDLSITVSGTYLGAGATICTISTLAAGGAASCSGLIDAGTSVTFSNAVADGADMRWETGQATQTPSSGSTTTADYFLQLQDTYRATPNAQTTWDAALVAPSVTGTVLGVGSTSVCTLTLTSGGGAASCTGWADYNTPVTLGAISGAPPNSRWQARGTTSFSLIGPAGQTFNVDYYKQYTLTVTGGNGVVYSIPSQTGDSYWDSGTTLTVSSNGVYDRGAGTRQRLSSYAIDGGANTLVDTAGTVTTPALTMSSAHTVNFNSLTQYQLTLDGGATASLSSVTPPTISGDDYWYDSGTSVTLVLNGAWDRTSASGDRLVSYSVDGGASTATATTGTVTVLSSVAISSPEAITTTTALQYFLGVVGGNGIVYSAPPPIAGDTGWYDSGTSLTVSSDGVYDRAAGTGERVSSWNVDGGASNVVATAGTVTTTSIGMTATHTVTFDSVTQYQVTLNAGAVSSFSSITPPAIAGDDYWYDSGTSVTYSGDGVFARAAGTGTRATGWSIDSGPTTAVLTTGTFTVSLGSLSAPHAVGVSTVTQYRLNLDAGAIGALVSVTPPTIPGDNYWYDSGTGVTLTLDGVFGRANGVGMRLTDYAIDGGASVPVSTTGTVTVLSALLMVSPHTVTTSTVSQYQVSLDAGAVSALNSITPATLPGDNYWYDSGTSVTVTLHGVFGRSGGIGNRLAGYSVNGGANIPASTVGTVTVIAALSIASAQSITTTVATQYQLTLDATSTLALGSLTAPTIAGDNFWYDAGTPVTLALDGVWGRSPSTGNRLTSFTINGGAPTETATTGSVAVLSADPISSAESIASTSVTQFFLAVIGGNGISYSADPPIAGDTGWYDSGTSLTVSSNGVSNRVAGTGERVSSWAVDGGANTNVDAIGRVTTSSVTMSAAHTVRFNSVVQYEVSLDYYSTSSLSSCTAPTISGDDYWYDSGTAVTCSLNGVWGRSGGVGDRLTSYSLNGAAATAVSTTGLVTALNVASITSPQSLVSTEATQYQLVLSVNPAAAGTVTFGTPPTITGDSGWYDSGTTASFSVLPNIGFQFSRWVGTGSCSFTGSLLSSSISLVCPASESASFGSTVVQPIILQGAVPGGPIPEFTVNGCYAAPTQILGDGSEQLVELTRSCSFNVSIFNVGGTRYGFSVSGAFSDTSPDETSCTSGTCDPITLTYFVQVGDQFSYAVSDGSMPSSPPTLTCTRLGVSGTCGALTVSPTLFWLDSGSPWSASELLVGSNGSVRWESAAASGFVSAPSSIVVAYTHQFLISIQASPQTGGTTDPASGTAQWVDSGSVVSLSASPSTGYNFSGWTSSNPRAIAFDNLKAGSTTATVGGPGVITARFGLPVVSFIFAESGLPAGTEWGVTLEGRTVTSTNASVTFELSPGTYSWTVTSPVPGSDGVRFMTAASSGTTTLAGQATQDVVFVTQYYLTVSVGSTAEGITLSPASGWYDSGSQLTLNASASSASHLEFVSWTGTGAGSYSGSLATARLSVNGLVTETANFSPEMGSVTFVESGLPAGAVWSVVLDGVNQTSYGDSITFSGLFVGSTVNWVVQSPSSAPGTGTLQILSAQTTTVTITFTTSPTTVTSVSTVVSSGSSGTTTLTVTVIRTNSETTSTSGQNGGNGLTGLDYALIVLVIVLLASLTYAILRNRRGRSPDG